MKDVLWLLGFLVLGNKMLITLSKFDLVSDNSNLNLISDG